MIIDTLWRQVYSFMEGERRQIKQLQVSLLIALIPIIIESVLERNLNSVKINSYYVFRLLVVYNLYALKTCISN